MPYGKLASVTHGLPGRPDLAPSPFRATRSDQIFPDHTASPLRAGELRRVQRHLAPGAILGRLPLPVVEDADYFGVLGECSEEMGVVW